MKHRGYDIPKVNFNDISEFNDYLKSKREVIEEGTVEEGKVESYNSEKGYGFIKRSNNSTVFFHYSNVIFSQNEINLSFVGTCYYIVINGCV